MNDDENKDIYSEKGREELLEAGEISAEEEGFMQGASGLGQGAKCRRCGKILGDYKEVFEQEVDGEIYRFCSKRCADKYLRERQR
jgi:hypothetical protein